MGLNATAVLQLGVLETLITGVAGTNPINIDQANMIVALDANSTPAITKVIHDKPTFSGSTELLDLTNAPGTNITAGDADAIDVSGLRLHMWIFRNLSTTNELTIEADASNGYELFGTGGKLTIPKATSAVPSGLVAVVPESGVDVVNATNDEILFTGTSGEIFEYILLFG